MRSLSAAVRTLARNAGYTSIALATLAVGIGCGAAVFSLLDAIYFRPIPIRSADELVRITFNSPKTTFGLLSYPEYQSLGNVPGFSDVVAIGRRGVTFHQKDETLPMIIHYVSGNYFESFGIPVYLGRGLNQTDDIPQATTPYVVINYQMWVDQLARRPDVINSKIQLNDTAFTVVGVTAPGFLGLNRLQRTDVWVTVAQAHFVVPGMKQSLMAPFDRWFEIVGRVRPESKTIVATQLNTILANWRTQNTEHYNGATLNARDYLEEDRNGRAQGVVFLSLVVFVLLIACANVANLGLARGEARRYDVAVRAALGASRWQLISDLLREALVISFAAALLG